MTDTGPTAPQILGSQSNLPHQIFLRYAWGAEEKVELQNEADRFIGQAEIQGLASAVEVAVQQGREAYRYGKQLDELLNTQGSPSAIDWLEALQVKLDRKILVHLNKRVEKWQLRQDQLKARAANPVFYSGISPVKFSEHHPNSLRHLTPSNDWTVYIDETGQVFDETALEEGLFSPRLGRMVALIVPARTQLTPLPTGFHATEASHEDVDGTLDYLLEQNVGILGFTVSDPGAVAGNWFSHIVLLARWVLLQLPIESVSSTRVRFKIERNDARLAYQPIDSVANLLEGEFRAIDPERYGGVQVVTQLMDKSDPMNGYVDTLAFTWGSPSPISKDRLKKSALLGHCFLHPAQWAIDRLYLAVARDARLLPSDWYALCTAIASEPKGGLLAHFLQKLGESARQNRSNWQHYLDEVRARFRGKDYTLSEMNHALDWLEEYAPAGEQLPSIYRLPLETARLGQENHSGKVNMARLETCLKLINDLEEEDAHEACGALLRVAVSGSNNFEFQIMQPVLKKWLDLPIAVSGIKNYGRLHSTLGQMYAFCNQPESALDHFEKSLALFDRLSDKQSAVREKQQTNSYKLICQMDHGQVDPERFLTVLTGEDDWCSYSRTLATSGQGSRYPHHLWLRALLTFPDVSRQARETYIQQSHQWQHGADHPWGLIDAYRAWLLKLADKGDQSSARMSVAIQTCSNTDNGPVLWWMAEVLRTMARCLNLNNVEPPTQEMRAFLETRLPAAPHNRLSDFAQAGYCNHKTLMFWLQQCLPFNFH